MKALLKALLVFGLVSLTGILLDRILRSDGIPGRYLLDLSNLLTGVCAGALFYYATREQARRQQLIEEKLRVIADMNHHIRNALQALAFYRVKSSDEKEMNVIDQAVSRITWALKEILPKYPSPETIDEAVSAAQKKLAAKASSKPGQRSAS
jgi:hypothetical protein